MLADGKMQIAYGGCGGNRTRSSVFNTSALSSRSPLTFSWRVESGITTPHWPTPSHGMQGTIWKRLGHYCLPTCSRMNEDPSIPRVKFDDLPTSVAPWLGVIITGTAFTVDELPITYHGHHQKAVCTFPAASYPWSASASTRLYN